MNGSLNSENGTFSPKNTLWRKTPHGAILGALLFTIFLTTFCLVFFLKKITIFSAMKMILLPVDDKTEDEFKKLD